MFKYICCGEFELGGYCHYCNRRRSLVIDSNRFSQLLSLEQIFSLLCDPLGAAGAELFRTAIIIAEPQYRALIRYLQSRLPLKYSQQLTNAEQSLIELARRIKSAGIQRAQISESIAERLFELSQWIGDSKTDELDRIVYGSLRQAALVMLGRCKIK